MTMFMPITRKSLGGVGLVLALVAPAFGQAPGAGEPVETLVAQAIRARVGNPHAEVTLVGVDASVPIPRRLKSIRLDPAAILGKPMRVTLAPVTGAPLVATLTVRVTVDHIVAVRDIARAETLGAADVTVRHEEIRGIPLRRLPQLAEVVGGRTLRPIPAGAVFLPGAVALRRFVEPGDRVTVVARAGDAEVSATLVAADGGDPGDIIRVNHPESRKQIRARVLSPGLVEVHHVR
jgi:flagella basal body P-ring formation protein FlgA